MTETEFVRGYQNPITLSVEPELKQTPDLQCSVRIIRSNTLKERDGLPLDSFGGTYSPPVIGRAVAVEAAEGYLVSASLVDKLAVESAGIEVEQEYDVFGDDAFSHDWYEL